MIITEIAIAVFSGVLVMGIGAIFKTVVHIDQRLDKYETRITRLETRAGII